MNIQDPETMQQSYRTTYWLITAQTNSITDSESLLQLPFPANCMNWVVGHLVVHRDFVLDLLGQPTVWGDIEYRRYATGSRPIKNAEQALPFHEILEALALSQERIATGMNMVTPALWLTDTNLNGRQGSIGALIAGYHWHETYHCGQLEILRQLAGKQDEVI
jgi:hypothetical protein